MAELVTEVEESVEGGFLFNLYTGIPSWVVKIAKLLRLGTLAATNRHRNSKSPGKSHVNGNLKSYDIY